MKSKELPIEDLAPLFSLSRDAVLGVRSGTVVFANPAARQLFAREAAGMHISDLIPEIDPGLTGESYVTGATINGVTHTVTAAVCRGVLILTIQRQEQTVPAVPAAALSRMRSAAFNLRFSLDKVASQNENVDDPYVSVMYHSYHSLLHLIEQLSDVTALTRGDMVCRMQTLDLALLVRDVVDSVSYFARDREVEFSCRVPDEPCCVTGDREKLEQLVLILLSNSLLHTLRGGHISVGLQRTGKQYILSVDDDGEGMSGDKMGYVFSLPHEASPAAFSGAGMGLFIAHGLARLHGGAIVLQSTEGKGTRVRLTFPEDDRLVVRDADYQTPRGPDLILTELSSVLPHQAYGRKALD